jgi:hypothetical protein
MTLNIGQTEKEAVLVLGVHRSGTSSLARVLNLIGAAGPKSLMDADRFNERGYWESWVITALNEDILKSAGTVWDDWRAFNTGWFVSPLAAGFGQRAVAALASEFGAAPLIVVKDPRMCRLMPLWHKLFSDGGYTIRVVIPIRSPIEVARSLWFRDRIPVSKGVLIWLRHLLDAEAATRDFPRALIDWSAFIADWQLAMKRAGDQIGLKWPRLSDRAATEIDQFLDPNLRHHLSDAAELALHPNVNNWVEDSYLALITLASDPFSNSARQVLDEIRREFDGAAAMFGQIMIEIEDALANARQERDSAKSEKEALGTERAALFEASKAESELAAVEVASREGQINKLTSECNALQTQLQAAAAERDRFAEEVSVHTARISELTAAHDAIRTQINVANAERDHVHAAIAERDRLGGELANQTSRADELTAERDALMLQLLAATADRDRLAAETQAHEARAAELAEGQRALRQQLQTSAAELKQVRDEPLLSSLARRFRALWK